MPPPPTVTRESAERAVRPARRAPPREASAVRCPWCEGRLVALMLAGGPSWKCACGLLRRTAEGGWEKVEHG